MPVRPDAMRGLALLVIALLAGPAAHAQPFVFEGPRDTWKTAKAAYLRVGEQCPRMITSEPDYAAIGLHLVAPGSQGLQGPLIQQFESRSVLVITLRLGPKVRTVPARIVPKNRVMTLTVIDTQRTAIIALDTASALWLCDKTVPEGDRIALVPAPALHDILSH